jgi:hypothetical protein
MQGGSWVDFAAMAVRQVILASALPINCSGFSEASGTLWVQGTTSAECKTGILAELTVMSSSGLSHD